MATCVEKPQRFALIANPQGLSVDDIVPIKKDAIPMRTFFDVLEMFADKHGYEIEQIENSSNGIYGLTIRLLPVQAQYDVFFDDDEFINNGYYMKWNLGGNGNRQLLYAACMHERSRSASRTCPWTYSSD